MAWRAEFPNGNNSRHLLHSILYNLLRADGIADFHGIEGCALGSVLRARQNCSIFRYPDSGQGGGAPAKEISAECVDWNSRRNKVGRRRFFYLT